LQNRQEMSTQVPYEFHKDGHAGRLLEPHGNVRFRGMTAKECVVHSRQNSAYSTCFFSVSQIEDSVTKNALDRGNYY